MYSAHKARRSFVMRLQKNICAFPNTCQRGSLLLLTLSLRRPGCNKLPNEQTLQSGQRKSGHWQTIRTPKWGECGGKEGKWPHASKQSLADCMKEGSAYLGRWTVACIWNNWMLQRKHRFDWFSVNIYTLYFTFSKHF